MTIYEIGGLSIPEVGTAKDGLESICICPGCQKPKLSVNKETLIYQCWVCGWTGGKCKRIDGGIDETPTVKKESKIAVDSATVDTYIRLLVGSLEINEFVKAYFLQKKIPIQLAERFNIGYSSKKIQYPHEPTAKALGLLNKAGNSRCYKRIVFPVMHDDKFVFFTARATSEEMDAKWLDASIPGGKKKIINFDALAKHDEIFLLEGYTDVLSHIAHGYENTVGMLGASIFDESHGEFFKNKKVFIGYDNDFAGRRNTLSISATFTRLFVPHQYIKLPLDFDLTDYYVAGNTELEFGDVSELQTGERILEHKRTEPNLIIYRYGGFEVTVSDINQRRGSLKALVSFYKGSKVQASSNLDLGSQRSRNALAREISNTCATVSTSEAKTMLLDLFGSLKEKLETDNKEEVKVQSYVMTEAERERAVAALQSDRLLYRIKVALDRQELIGEDKNKILLYLIFSSRLMKKPISAVIKGLSSSGKTWLMNKTLSLIPPEGKMVIQQATSRAFYYVGETDLRHKVIVIGEMHGSDEASYSIREAQDGVGDGDLVIYTVEKDPETNRNATVEHRVQGPVGFVTSTTDVTIHAENETRNFSIYVAIDEEKVKETAKVLVNKYEGKSNCLSEEELLLFHNIQRCLKQDVQIKIPYIGFVLSKFPNHPIRIMRDRARFCVLIETITMIHQFQRKVIVDDEGKEWIEANISDYKIAVELLNEILAETISEIPPRSRDIYNEVLLMQEDYVEENKGTESIINDYDENKLRAKFYTTYKQISERESMISMKASDIRRWSKPLFENGYFDYFDGDDEKKKGGRGKETHLVPISKSFFDSFLPSVEEIAAYLGVDKCSVYDPVTGEIQEISGVVDDIEL